MKSELNTEEGEAASQNLDPPSLPAPPFHSGRPTWAEINLNHLLHNLRLTRTALGQGVAVMAAVKADAYGHDAALCAPALEREGADWFGVALPEEAARLREAGVTRPILCLGSFWEGQEDFVIAHDITPIIFRLDLLDRLDRAARAFGRVVSYHLKVDTGLGRLGVPFADLEDFLDGAAQYKNARLDGLMTHFASADVPDQIDFTEQQIRRFQTAIEIVRGRGHAPRWIHLSNSAATHALPQAWGNLVRPGGILYGLFSDTIRPDVPALDWRPVLSLHARITLLKTVPPGTPLGYGRTFVTRRESRIATIPIGYADGLPRALSNRGRVIVRGQFAPMVGRISMDLTLVDVTDIEGAALGDEVILIGSQGDRRITAAEIAAQVGTISYEITCGISSRVPRITIDRPEVMAHN